MRAARCKSTAMAEQLAIVPSVDPWQDVRAIAPGCILARRIDCSGERILQFWLRFERTPANLERGAEIYDGATFITPAPPGTDAEARHAREAIIAAADTAYTPIEAEA